MTQNLPPDSGRKKAYDKAKVVPIKYLHGDGSVSSPEAAVLGNQLLPPDAKRAELWAKSPLDAVKFMLQDGSVYDGYGLIEMIADLQSALENIAGRIPVFYGSSESPSGSVGDDIDDLALSEFTGFTPDTELTNAVVFYANGVIGVITAVSSPKYSMRIVQVFNQQQ